MKFKTFLLLNLLLSTPSLFAVQVKKCPRAFNLDVRNIEKINKSYVLSDAANQDYADYVSIEYFFENELTFNRSFYLESNYVSTCRYASLDNSKWFAQAEIKGSDKEAYFTLEMSTPSKLDPKDFNRFSLIAYLPQSEENDQYNFSQKTINISAHGANDVWDESFRYFIKLGSGELVLENQFLVENFPILSHVIECDSFTHRDMVEMIYDNEALFSELNDQAAVLLGKWAEDVINKELMSLNDCNSREASYLKLQRLIKKINISIGNKYDLLSSKAINNENTLIARMIDVLNKTGVRLWIINNTKY
ncbi:MAG: hypothetical protein KBD78_16735 [Oligoflexales bacterium]|nr:hypothetical protein [Oligoflexales bacterium]